MLTVAVIAVPTADGVVMVVETGVVVATTVLVMLIAAAFAGATDRTPAPNAATATSAMRLKVVFVDIFFLSFSREQEFPALGFG
jgi:hypothetical protein